MFDIGEWVKIKVTNVYGIIVKSFNDLYDLRTHRLDLNRHFNHGSFHEDLEPINHKVDENVKFKKRKI